MWNDNKALAIMVVGMFLAMASCTAIEKYTDAKYSSQQCPEGKPEVQK